MQFLNMSAGITPKLLCLSFTCLLQPGSVRHYSNLHMYMPVLTRHKPTPGSKKHKQAGATLPRNACLRSCNNSSATDHGCHTCSSTIQYCTVQAAPFQSKHNRAQHLSWRTANNCKGEREICCCLVCNESPVHVFRVFEAGDLLWQLLIVLLAAHPSSLSLKCRPCCTYTSPAKQGPQVLYKRNFAICSMCTCSADASDTALPSALLACEEIDLCSHCLPWPCR
jgi:hypothetical protein